MAEQRLTNDLIADPSLYRLGLQLSDRALDVVLTSRVSDIPSINRRIELPVSVAGSASSPLEEAVYDNPLLTADFGRTDIVVDSQRFFLLPAERAADDGALAADIELLYPETDLVPVVNYPDPERTAFVTLIEPEITRFFGRTFTGAPIVHRLSAITRYHLLRNHIGTTGKLHVRLHGDRTDIIALGHQGILLVNSYYTPTPDDAVYYTMAVARELGYDNETDRVLVSGARERRDDYIRMIRRFVTFVMPEIFPPAIAPSGADEPGHEPFALACFQLCE